MKETAEAGTPTRPASDCAPSRPSITYQSILALQPDARNPRTHSKRQIRQIADSIRTFGFTNPILVDEKGSVMAGHGRLEAAKLLGIRQVPTIRIGDLTEAQKRAPGYPFNRTHPGLQFSRGGSLEGDPGSAGARAPRAAWATPPGAAWWR